MGPNPAVADVRRAVRLALASYPVSVPVLVAASGGADSTALAAAVAFDCVRTGRAAGLVTVDHALQPGSRERARQVAALGWELGFDPVQLLPVAVGSAGGPEAAARAARYAALESVRGDAMILLGHTADDQAETVLLGLGRGSGARSILGMRPAAGGYLRPLLELRRSVTEQACAALGLPVWQDPHNVDPRFRRVRVRREVLPLLEDVLAGGVTEALARTARQLQADEDTLAALTGRVLESATGAAGLAVAPLLEQPPGLVARCVKAWAEGAGSGALAAVHVAGLTALVLDWHGQGPLELPGGVRVRRSSGTLELLRAADGP